MIFDNEGFTRVVLEFLSASVKNVSEIEGCWCEIQQCINNMDQTVQSFAQQEQNSVDTIVNPHNLRPLNLGSGLCGSTIVDPDGCGATIKVKT